MVKRVLLIHCCAFALCTAFVNEENERFEHNPTHPKDAVYTTLEPLRDFDGSIDFYKGWGMWHTPTWRRSKSSTLTFEEFNLKYFPQYSSTPNWAEYDTYPFTIPENRSRGDILRAFLQHTVHSFEVEEYFRDHKRRTWFSLEDTFEKEAWRGWTTTAFPADLMVYNQNATWADIDEIMKNERAEEPDLQGEFDYKSDEYLKMLNDQQGIDSNSMINREGVLKINKTMI